MGCTVVEDTTCSSRKVSFGGRLELQDKHKSGFSFRKLIAVEGQDEVNFFNELIKFISTNFIKNEFECRFDPIFEEKIENILSKALNHVE